MRSALVVALFLACAVLIIAVLQASKWAQESGDGDDAAVRLAVPSLDVG